MTATAKVHPFEAANLGLAPFRCVGVETRVGPYIIENGDGTRTEIGAPGQPMGSCDYCGQGIADCYKILSADGKRFVVGCDCVRRVYQEAEQDLPPSVRKQIAQLARDKREAARPAKEAKHLERVRAAVAILEADAALLRDVPHPLSSRARLGETMRDSLTWLIAHAGTAGRTRACLAIERAAAAKRDSIAG